MIIDAHSHGFHGKTFDKLADLGGEWTKKVVADEHNRAKARPQYLDIPLRVELLNKYNFDFQVVTPSIHVEVNFFPGDAVAKLAFSKAINENMARLMEDSKGKLLAIGTIPLESLNSGGLMEIERAINTLGLKGLSISTNVNGKPLDLPEFEPFWAKAQEMDFPVYIHPQDPASHEGRSYEADFDLTHNFGWPFETVLTFSRLVFSGIMDKYPKLKVLSHHLGGGMIPFLWGRIMETYAPEKQQSMIGKTMPKPLFDYFSKFYYDTAVGGSAAAVKCAYDVFGANQIIFATDGPFGPDNGEGRMKTYPQVVKSLGLSQEEEDKIFSGNIKKILNMQ